jgi:predicted nucleotidyltransferase
MSTETDSLSNILFGQIRGGVLGLLYGQADKTFYLRQIARQLHASVGSVQRELENLTRIGLIVRNSIGSQVFFQANQDNAVFPELRALLNKTVGVFHILSSTLKPLANRINVAFIYGSFARQAETAYSDIDLMIIGKVSLEDVFDAFSGVESSVGRPVNPTVYSPQEFRLKVKNGNHFVNAILKAQKVFLIGNDDELGKMGGVRMAKTRAKQSQ